MTETIEVVGKLPQRGADEILLKVSDSVFSGWLSLRVTRGIERCPNDFELSLTELYSQDEPDVMTITPGEKCELKIGRDLVITGYVDRQDISFGPAGHTITVVGRGKCQDLVDCSAMWPGQQIVAPSVLYVARKLAEPYGVKVDGLQGPPVGQGGNNAALPLVVVPIGESVWSVLERLCRVAGMLLYELPDGSLFIGPGVASNQIAGIAQQQGIPVLEPRYAASGFKEGVNVLAARASFGNDQRYSNYAAYRFSTALYPDLGGDVGVVATATDGGVGRYRLLAMVAEAERDISMGHAQALTSWEAARRWGRSRAVHVTTDSWRDAAGQLYEPNTLVPLDLPTLKVTDVSWLISEVTYRKDENGTACDLLLMRPESFQVRPTLPAYVLPADQAALPPNLAQP